MSEKKSGLQKNGTEVSSSAENSVDAQANTVKQKLFILKAKAKNLKNAEQFLKNRDFEVISTTDMKSAISTILSGQASIIMLSTDHANPKVMKLPQIIQQSFNTPIIIFAEGVSQKGAAALRETRHPYILYPPVSGPAVERMILKIERDRKEKTESASHSKEKSASEAGQDHSTMKFSGQNANGGDDIIMQSKKAEQEFAKMFSSDGSIDSNTSISDSDEGDEHGKGGFSQGQSSYGHDGQSNSPDDASSVRNYLNRDPNDPANSDFSGSEIRGPGHAGTSRSAGPKGPGTRQQSDSDTEDGLNAPATFSQTQATPKNQNKQSEEAGDPSQGDSASGFSSNLKSKSADGSVPDENGDEPETSGLGLPKFVGMNRKGDMYMPPQGETGSGNSSSFASVAKANSHVTTTNEKKADNELSAAEILAKKDVNLLTFKSDENASFLIKGSRHAVEKSTKFVQGMKVSKIQTCAKVSCFNIESSKFSGVVIVAFGEKDKVDEHFNKSVRNYLAEYLKNNGLEVSTGDLHQLKLKEVNFEDWSIREADFLMTSIHEGNEIALAFFPRDNKETPLELSAQTSMLKMTIDEIKVDEPLEFDVYIYLPANEKYVRYTARNGVLYSKQKDRLKSGGHAKIHIRKESESDLSRYRVQNFLNEKIESYKKAKNVA